VFRIVSEYLASRAVTVLALGVFIGLAVPALAAFARPVMSLAIAVLLVMSVMRMDLPHVRDLLARPGRLSFAIVIVLVISPAAVWLVCAMPRVPSGLILAVMLMAAAPPITASPAMASLLDLDADLCLLVMVGALFLAPFTVSIMAWAIGFEMTIPLLTLFLRLLGFVVGCAVVGVVLRKVMGLERIRDNKARFDLIAVFWLLVFAIAIMDGVTAKAIAEPVRVLWVVALSFIANIGLFVLAAMLTRSWGWRQSFAVGLGAANCNMGLLLAVLPSDIDPDIFLYFAIAQIPMYLTPMLLKPVVRSLQSRG